MWFCMLLIIMSLLSRKMVCLGKKKSTFIFKIYSTLWFFSVSNNRITLFIFTHRKKTPDQNAPLPPLPLHLHPPAQKQCLLEMKKPRSGLVWNGELYSRNYLILWTHEKLAKAWLKFKITFLYIASASTCFIWVHSMFCIIESVNSLSFHENVSF